MKKKQKIVLTVLFIATLAFIFSNSMKSIPDSQKTSMGVTELLRPVIGFFIGEENVTDHLVRKLAHFAEFGLLGVELALLLTVYEKINVRCIVNSLFLGLFAALCDETIQLFFERGAQIQDVWLDFSGAATGIAGLLLLAALIHRIKNSLRSRKNHV